MGHKIKILIFLLVLILIGYDNTQAQSQQDTTTVTIPKVELNQFFQAVDSLQSETALLRELIANQRSQIFKLEYIVSQDSLVLSLKDMRIQLMSDEIKYHTDYIKRIERNKWMDSKLLWFTVGAATIVVSSIVLDNIQTTTQ